jgi:hypothetical protein
MEFRNDKGTVLTIRPIRFLYTSALVALLFINFGMWAGVMGLLLNVDLTLKD